MVPLLCFLWGIFMTVGGALWLLFMIARPRSWARINDAENSFWIRRGLPIKWVGACKNYEQGNGFKVLIAFSVIVGLILIVSPSVVHYRHG